MKIGIDLDGVVFNSETLWAVYAELYDCIELQRNSLRNLGEPRVQNDYDWSEEEMNNYLNKYIGIENFDIMPGAKEVLELLRKDGHELILVTARGCKETATDNKKIAENKLKENNIKFDKYYWAQKEKVDICKKESIDYMIDDNYHICEAMNKENIGAIYFRSLNRKHLELEGKFKEVTNWGEIYRFIKGQENRA